MKRRNRAHTPDYYQNNTSFMWNDQGLGPNAFTFKAVINSMIFDCIGVLTHDMKKIHFRRVALVTWANVSGREILKMPPLWQLGLIATHVVNSHSAATMFILEINEIDEFFPKKVGDQIRAHILARELEG